MLLLTVLPGRCLLEERVKCEACQKMIHQSYLFLWLKRFLFNSFIFLLSDSRVANQTEEFKGGHTSQKSGSCWSNVTSDAVTVLQLNCQRMIFSLLLRGKVLQGITQTFHMIQSARFLHLNCWDNVGGGEGLQNFSGAVVMNAGMCYMFQLKLTFICTLLTLQVYLE